MIHHFVSMDVSQYFLVKVIIDNKVTYRFYRGAFRDFLSQNDLRDHLPPPQYPEYWVSDVPFTVEDFERLTGQKKIGAIGWTGVETYDWVMEPEPNLK
jgi:hypothetical protein